ncbi:MAG: hypothetical protein IAF94_00035, partial [Pirellulaceae bacterium]|nr:hypothetical protein [Pirellulaceae bacterium]
MTLSDARTILGLGSEEDPRPLLDEFVQARDQVAALARTSTDPKLTGRYQQDLIEIDQAIHTVHEYLATSSKSDGKAPTSVPPAIVPVEAAPVKIESQEAPPSVSPTVVPAQAATQKAAPPAKPAPASPAAASPKPAPEKQKKSPVTPPAAAPPKPAPVKSEPQPFAPAAAPAKPAPARTKPLNAPPPALQDEFFNPNLPARAKSTNRPRSRANSYRVWLLVLFIGAAGGLWIFVKTKQSHEKMRLDRLATLEQEGTALIENRRWPEATMTFAEIESLSPGSELATRGRHGIEVGMAEEQTQFIAYWTGQAVAELDAGRLDEAASAARQVLDKYPDEKEAKDVLGQVAAASAGKSRAIAIVAAREAMEGRKWTAAIATVQKILAASPNDPDATAILTTATAALEKAASDVPRAAELLKMAIARDQGKYDPQALAWIREASFLAPESAEIAAQLEKISSYTRTLHVPGDYATPQEALENSRDRDRIVLGAATWK